MFLYRSKGKIDFQTHRKLRKKKFREKEKKGEKIMGNISSIITKVMRTLPKMEGMSGKVHFDAK